MQFQGSSEQKDYKPASAPAGLKTIQQAEQATGQKLSPGGTFTTYFIVGFILTVLFGLAFGFLAKEVFAGALSDFDRTVELDVHSWPGPFFFDIFWFGTQFGGVTATIILSIIVGGFLFWRRKIGGAIFFVATMAGIEIINAGLKLLFHRAGPTYFPAQWNEGSYSFPSGHSVSALAFYGALIFLVWHYTPKALWRGLMIVVGVAMILIVGTSRVYFGEHYPTDVIGAYLLALLWLVLTSLGFESFLWRQRRQGRLKNSAEALH